MCRYRRLALKFHPEMNAEPGAKEEFNRICEAYDVLSDRAHMGLHGTAWAVDKACSSPRQCAPLHARAAKRKGFYDLFGEHALKDGVPDGQGGQQPAGVEEAGGARAAPGGRWPSGQPTALLPGRSSGVERAQGG